MKRASHQDLEPLAVGRRTESADKSDALQTLRAVRRHPAVAKRLECVRLQRRFPKARCKSVAGRFMENPLPLFRTHWGDEPNEWNAEILFGTMAARRTEKAAPNWSSVLRFIERAWHRFASRKRARIADGRLDWRGLFLLTAMLFCPSILLRAGEVKSDDNPSKPIPIGKGK